MNSDIRPAVSLALLSSSTIQFLAGSLQTELENWGWEPRLWQSGFNQYRQDIADPASRLYRERPEAVILYLEGEDIFADFLRNPFSGDRRARDERVRDAIAELENWIRVIQTQLPGSVLILNTVCLPPVNALTGLEYHSPWALTDLAVNYNTGLRRIAAEYSNVLVNDVSALVTQMGYRQWFDPRLWYLARCRLSSEATRALARSTVSVLRAWKGQTRKCLALDLDNTLWGGVIGEDGIEHIVLGEEGLGLAYAEFQEELANLARKGILLAICSKNNEEDALEVLRKHPSMRLRESDFAALSINWRDKAANLRELAKSLNIGLDGFVFVDDNPAERALIRESLPEVHVPEWPQDVSDFKAALQELSTRCFPRISLTIEDQQRSAMYRSESERQTLKASSTSLEDYYRSLEMRAEVGTADRSSIPRLAQLTQKTNQFNLTTRRYTEAEIQSLACSSKVLALWLRLRDRFSDEGIVGALILKEYEPGAWMIDTFLLSCRVIGRTVERAFLGWVCRILQERGARVLVGEYIPTRKNGLAADVYRNLGFELVEESQGVTRWQLVIAGAHVTIPEWIAVEVREGLLHA